MTAESIIRIAYARLKAIRDNIPDQNTIGMDYIRDYHEILDSLESLGAKLTAFRIGNAAIHKEDDDEYAWCYPAFFKAKVEGIVNLFELTTSKGGIRVGFSPPD